MNPKTYLHNLLVRLTTELFPNCDIKVLPDSFPFVSDGMQIEVEHPIHGSIEVLGGGTVHSDILAKNGFSERDSPKLVAWGLGLERLTMILFEIPDIRLFWSDDERFLSQFRNDQINIFRPYSNLPNISRDISFWLPPEDVCPDQLTWKQENSFFDMVRDSGDDTIETVSKIDTFRHPIDKKMSCCYRVTFSAAADCQNPADFGYHANGIMRKMTDAVTEVFRVTIR